MKKKTINLNANVSASGFLPKANNKIKYWLRWIRKNQRWVLV